MKAMIFGCGYLGRRVANAWIMQGHEVCAITRSAEKADSLERAGIEPHVADICKPDSLKNLRDSEIVLYAIGFDQNSGRTHEEVTLGGTQNVLNHVRHRCSRFIYVSSTSVYGQTAGEWVDETSVCEPNQPGGQLNLAAEQLVRDHCSSPGAATFNIMRLAGIYGPGRLLSRLDQLRSRSPISGRSDSWLNLIHVDDAVTAIQACAANGGQETIYNVIDDHPIRRGEYFEMLAKLVGAPTPIFDTSQPGARGSGGLNKRCANQRLRTALGWSPVYSSIDTGLPAAVNANVQ